MPMSEYYELSPGFESRTLQVYLSDWNAFNLLIMQCQIDSYEDGKLKSEKFSGTD